MFPILHGVQVPKEMEEGGIGREGGRERREEGKVSSPRCSDVCKCPQSSI